MSQQAHHEAVAAAKHAIGELQETLSLATDKQDEAQTLTALATGGSEASTEAGFNAFEFIAVLREKIQEVYRVTEQAVAELDRYDGGF